MTEENIFVDLKQKIKNEGQSQKQLTIVKFIEKRIEEIMEEIDFPIREYEIKIEQDQKAKTIDKTVMTLVLRQKRPKE